MKDDGLGVLDNYERIELGLAGIRNALRDKNRKRGTKDARNHLKDVEEQFSQSVFDAKRLRTRGKAMSDVLNEMLPLIENKKKKKKKSGGGGK